MLNLLFKLLSVPATGAARIVDWNVRFRGPFNPAWIVLLALLLAAGVYWLYRRHEGDLSAARRTLLASLRTLFLLLILALILRPVLQFTLQGTIRRAFLLMFDDSASMSIKDQRVTAPDRKRVAIAEDLVDPTKGLDVAEPSGAKLDGVSRLDLVRSVFRNPRMALLKRLASAYDLRAFRFGTDVDDLVTRPNATGENVPTAEETTAALVKADWLGALKAQDPVTPLGDAVRDLLGRSRGQPLAGIFVITDGASNSGSSPRAAADLAKQQGVPLYVYGVGISSPRDVVVANLFAQETAFFDDEVPVTVRVRSQGMDSKNTTMKLQLVYKDQSGHETIDQTIEQPVTLSDGEQVVSMKITPHQKDKSEKQKEYEIRALIDPSPEESVQDNNSVQQRLRVIDGKIKVLYIEQSPRWEFRYLQEQLVRDRRIKLSCVLLDGMPSTAGTEGSPYIKGIPATRDALIDNYDLIILGDIDPHSFTNAQMDAIGDFVSKFGGGLLIIPGRQQGLAALKGTIFEKMSPVELPDDRGRARMDEPSDKPIELELTAAGRRSTMLRLSDKDAESAARWAKLPPIYWVANVARAKPGAEVLLDDADPSKATRFGKMPVFAVQQYGLGQVFYAGTDNTWRWRRNNGDEYYITLWGQIVQRLALPHLLGESKRIQLSTDKKDYVTGERVTVYARVYGQDYNPSTDPQIEGTYKSESGREGHVTLRPMPEQPGFYRGDFIIPEAGAYQFNLDKDDKTKLSFAATTPKIELGETAMQEAQLKEMAEVSGGAFFREEDLSKLPDQVQLKTEKVTSKAEVEIWSSPLYFLLLLSVVTAEWVLRKLYQLK